MPGFTMDLITRNLASAQGLFQIAVISVSLLLAWLTARTLKRLVPEQLAPGLAKIGTGSAHRIIFPLALLVFAWVARFVLAKVQPVPLLNIAIPLIAAYAIIRLAVYLLRHIIPPSDTLKAFERIIVYSVWGIFVLYLSGALGEMASALDDINFAVGKQKISLLTILEAIFSAAITIFIALGVSSVVEKRVMKAESLDLSSRVVIGKFVRALALVLAVLIALPLVGIDLTLLSVVGGALGVGLGFGLQKIASNYVSGFIILLDHSIRIGDFVTIENRQGIVEAIRARYTVIRSLDGSNAIVPNDTLITSTVVNHSYTDTKVLVQVPVTISYDSDLDAARAIMNAAARAEQRVLAEPEPAVLVKALGDHGIALELCAWINDPAQGQGTLRSDIMITIWHDFKAAGITIPITVQDMKVITNIPSVTGNTPGTPASNPPNA